MNHTRKYAARLLGSLLALALCFSAFQNVFTVSASSSVDVNHKCSLTLAYKSGETAYADQEIQLYRVAGVSSGGQFSPANAFGAYNVEVNGISSQSEWQTVTETFAARITADSLEPDALATTDKDGRAAFRELPAGLYLVRELRIEENNAVKVFADSLISLPNRDADGNWVYDVTASPKYEEYIPSYEDTPYRINLYWDDAGFEQNRPDKVTVKIYCDGELVETVILTSKDNWTYEWTAPDDGSVWDVVGENVPKYTFTTRKIGNNFLLEYHTTEKPDDTPDTQPTKPDAPSRPHIPGISPKTGDDSNPMIAVVLMAVSGMFLILFGILSRRRAQEDE